MTRPLILLLSVLMLSNCSEDRDSNRQETTTDASMMGPPIFMEPSTAGQWFAGDLHVHATGASNDTGGDSFPEDIKAVAQARALHFIVLTDHSNSTGSDPHTLVEDPSLFNQGPEFPYATRASQLSEGDFLMLDGNELSPVSDDMSVPTGHIGCIPRPGPVFRSDVHFTDRPRGSVTGADVLDEAHSAGCLTVLNHPYAQAMWIAYDWTSTEYDAIEVWNGGLNFDIADYAALKAWACDLSLGHRKSLVGGSDNHRVFVEPPGDLLNPALGEPTTWLWADRLDSVGLVDALEAGRTSVTDTKAPLILDIFDAQGRWLAMQGQAVDAREAAWIRVRGHSTEMYEARSLLIYGIPPGGCQDDRRAGESVVPDPGWEILANIEVLPGAFEVTLPMVLTSGHAIFAALRPPGSITSQHLGVGLTGAVYVE